MALAFEVMEKTLVNWNSSNSRLWWTLCWLCFDL